MSKTSFDQSSVRGEQRSVLYGQLREGPTTPTASTITVTTTRTRTKIPNESVLVARLTFLFFNVEWEVTLFSRLSFYFIDLFILFPFAKMVSYYNTLTSMFPTHHTAQPHHAVAAARHYFQGYHGHPVYTYPQHHPQGFHHPSATSPGNVGSAAAQYPTNTADLNSNVCPNGAGSAGQPGFGPHGEGYTANSSASPTSWPTSQTGWPGSSPFWPPPANCNVSGGQGSDAALSSDGVTSSSGGGTALPGGRSPDTPPRGSSDSLHLRGHSAPSPGFNGSNSSGSPRVTPTPGGVGSGYSGDFPDYGSYGNPQHHATHRGDSPGYKDDDPESGMPPSPLSPLALGCPSSRPQPARSPYEWMKKPSYQSQPDKSGKHLALTDPRPPRSFLISPGCLLVFPRKLLIVCLCVFFIFFENIFRFNLSDVERSAEKDKGTAANERQTNSPLYLSNSISCNITNATITKYILKYPNLKILQLDQNQIGESK